MTDKDWHPLTLKVMRLTKPRPSTRLPVSCEPNDLPGGSLAEAGRQEGGAIEGLEEFGLSEMVMLPPAFGSIFLGETLSCYINVFNDHTQPTSEVFVKVELRTETQRVTLTKSDGRPTESVGPGEAVDLLIHHEVKELGTHHLICSVLYTSSAGEQAIFHKTYKFAVAKPIDVKTKAYNIDDEVFLEAQLQNTTPAPIHIQSAALQPSEGFTVTDLNVVEGGTNTTFGKASYINPEDTRQYLFRLSPQAGHDARQLRTIGKLDIVWRTTMGGVGRLQTSALPRKPPEASEIQVRATHVPSNITTGVPFEIRCRIANYTPQAVDLRLHAEGSENPAVLLDQLTNVEVGVIEPQGSTEIAVRLLPLRAGLQPIRSFYLLERTTGRKCFLTNLEQIFIS